MKKIVNAYSLGLSSYAAVRRPLGSSLMSLRHLDQVPRQQAWWADDSQVPKTFPRSGRCCAQRSGIKEESLALGQHGGQPRS
jgi:hypothetical protein